MKKSLLFIVCLLSMFAVIWAMSEISSSYAEPEEALLARDKDLFLIPAYKQNDRALYFFIKNENHLGAAYVYKGFFGWKAGMLTWSSMETERNLENLGGYQKHESNLIFGLIRHGNERMIQVGKHTANILDLATLAPEEVEKFRLEGVYLWYLESDVRIN